VAFKHAVIFARPPRSFFRPSNRARSTEFGRRLAQKALHGAAIKRPVITLPAHNALTSCRRPLESRSRKPGSGLMQIFHSLSQYRRRKASNVGDRVMTVGIIMTVPNKFRLCAVLMFQTVITLPTVITYVS
jgi:hypothetical protein